MLSRCNNNIERKETVEDESKFTEKFFILAVNTDIIIEMLNNDNPNHLTSVNFELRSQIVDIVFAGEVLRILSGRKAIPTVKVDEKVALSPDGMIKYLFKVLRAFVEGENLEFDSSSQIIEFLKKTFAIKK